MVTGGEALIGIHAGAGGKSRRLRHSSESWNSGPPAEVRFQLSLE